MKLAGKAALITGADSGIGQAIAMRFAQEGADVVIHYGHDAAGAEDTASQVRQAGRRADVLRADLADPAAAQRLFEQVIARVGRIDILVNNAGTGSAAETSLDTTLDDFIRVINVDLVSPFALC